MAQSSPRASEYLNPHSDAYASLALTLIGRVPLRGSGVIDITASVVLPGSADICPRDRTWRDAAKLLEVIEVKGGTAKAEARMRAQCGARVFADLSAPTPRFVIALNDPNNRSGQSVSVFKGPDGRQIHVASLPKASDRTFKKRATALAMKLLHSNP